MSNLSVLFKGREGKGVTAAADMIVNMVKEKKINVNDLSIRDIAQSTLGEAGMRAMERCNDEAPMLKVKEEVDPVNLQAFLHITDLLITQGVVEAYNSPEYIGTSLVTEETSRRDNTREAGLAEIDDSALVVREGEEYPDTRFGEDYIDIPKSEKRGLKIGVTREMVFFDETHKILDLARSIGERVAVSKEKRILQVVLGITNPFVRKGVARNTYVLTGGGDPRVNALASNPLVDWIDIDEANQLFVGMTDDRTIPEPIMVKPNTIIHSPSKTMTVARILTATEIRKATNAGVDITIGSNPLAALPLRSVTSPWIDNLLIASGVSAANARNYWYIGEPKRAFRYRTLFPLQVISASPNNPAEFERDVVAQFRASERGVAYVRAPWLMAKSYDVA